jgi:thiosulfate dehydrogenase (quinone) large subunit
LDYQQNATVRWGMTAIAVVAGLWTLVHIILALAGSTANDGWDLALLVLFVLALILAFVEFAHERPALVSVKSNERFPEPAITRFFLASEGSAGLWFVVRMYVGAEWLLAGWEKVTSPAWGGSGKPSPDLSRGR